LPVAVLVLSQASPVLALDYEVAGRASVGVTDNALAAPEGTPGSGTDALLTLRGEAAMVWLRKYMEQKLGYLIGLDTYLHSSGGETLTNALRWQAAYDPLRWLHVATDFTATEGTLSSVDTVTTLGRAGIFSVPSGPRPAAPLRYLTLDGRQGATFTLNPDWRLFQGLSGQAFWPLESGSRRPASQSGDASLGVERSFERSGLSLSGHGAVTRAPEVRAGDAVVSPYRRGEVVEGLLGWRQTYSPSWSSFAAAGARAAWVPSGSPVRWKPSGRFDIHAVDHGRELVLSGARTATADVYVGDVFLGTHAGVTVGQVLDGPRRYGFHVVGTFDWAQALGREGADRGSAKIWQVRSIVSFIIKRPFRLTAEYAFTDQRATLPPQFDPTIQPPFRSFRRNLFLIGVEIRYSTFPAPDGSDRDLRGPSDDIGGDPRADLDTPTSARP
jgi:hypothetical protein